MEALEDRYEGNVADDQLLNEDKVNDLVGLTHLTEIVVSVFAGGKWSEIPERLTDNFIADFSPRVSVSGNRAVVTWQQVVMRSEGEGVEYASTNFWYSIYDGSQWLAPKKISASVSGGVSDYNVALNGSSIGIIYSEGYIYDSDGEDISVDNIYTLHINGSGLVTHNKITTDISVNGNPQISAFDNGFIFSNYTESLLGFSDVILGRLNANGDTDYDYNPGLAEVAGIVGSIPTFNYSLINDANGTAIAWTVYDIEADGYDIYTSRLIDGIFVAPTQLALLKSKNNSIVTLKGGLIELGGKVSVYYIQTGIKEYLEYLEDDTGTKDKPGEELYVDAQFKNDYIYRFSVSDDDVIPETELPILFSLTNTGLKDIVRIGIRFNNGIEEVLVNPPIPPCGTYSQRLSLDLTEVEDISYEINVTFSDGALPPRKGDINIAKPDVSIGKAMVLRSEGGVRHFSVNLYNSSGVPLSKGSGSRVRLSFYNDPMHSVKANGINDIIISDSDELDLIDDGGMSVLCKYAISADELDDMKEIPSEGIRLYIKAELFERYGSLTEENLIEESDYMENDSSIRFESMLRYRQNAVSVSADQFDSTTSTAVLSLSNNSMNPASFDSGTIAANLYDIAGRLIETQIVSLDGNISGESIIKKSVKFEQTGAYVLTGFEDKNSVIGYIRSYNPQYEVTVQLMQGNTEAYRTVIPEGMGNGFVEQKFIFNNVNPGIYSVVVTKDVHTKFTIGKVTVSEDAVNLIRDSRNEVKPITLRCGDIDGDNGIGPNDLGILLNIANYMKPTHTAGNQFADLEGDRSIGPNDLAILLNMYNYMKPAIDID
jgi:hypothetical protein